MTQEPDTGGPAFPNPEDDYHNADRGMTLLDWFAGQALQLSGIAAWQADGHHRDDESLAPKVRISTVVETAYNIAAAMLAERKKRGIK